MASVNTVILVGNLTQAPELRHTPGGAAVCDLRLAVNEVHRNGDGEKVESAVFIDINTWEKQAETCAEYLDKGSLVLVEGRLKVSEWTTEDGQKRSRIYVRAHRVQFLNTRRPDAEREPVLAGGGGGELDL